MSRFFGERGGPEALEPHDFPATGTNQLCGLQFRESPSGQRAGRDRQLGNLDRGRDLRQLAASKRGRRRRSATTPKAISTPNCPPHGEDYICGVTTDAAGGVHVAQHYSGIWDYAHNDPVTDADFLGGAYEGPICNIARASSGIKYNVFEPNGPVIKVPPSTVLRDATYALSIDPSSDDVYFSEGGIVTALSDDGILFDQFGSGDFTEARGVAVDEVSGTAYVSDTPNGRIAIFRGDPAYRVEVEPTGTGLGAVSAATPPLENCGDKGQCAGYYLPRPSSSRRRRSPTRRSTAGPDATTSASPATNAASKSPPPTARSSPNFTRAQADGHRRDDRHRDRLGQRRRRARRDPGLRRRRHLLGSL